MWFIQLFFVKKLTFNWQWLSVVKVLTLHNQIILFAQMLSVSNL